MKKRLLTMLLMVGLVLTTNGANIFTISNAQGHPGDEVTVSVALDNSDAVAVAELLIPLDAQLTYVDGSCTLNSARANGHYLSAAKEDAGLRVVIYGFEVNELVGSSGELFSFKLKLKKDPQTYPLSAETVIGNVAGENLTASVVDGSVTILSPELTVITTSTDYGHIPIRSTYSRSITLQNSGNEPLQVSGVEFSAAEFSTEESVFTIEAGATKDVTINYAPTMRGAISETVRFISNAINGTQKAALVADPFSVNELHVGSASGNSDEEVTISLTMNNMEPIVGMQCEFTLPEQLVYVKDSFKASDRASDCVVSSVADGQKLTLMMYSATNSPVSGEDGELATFKVKLNGTSGWYGLYPQNVVLSNVDMENMTSATSGNSVSISSPSMSSESELYMGSSSVTETATAKYSIYNSGSIALTINKVTFLAEGFSIAESSPISVEPWQSTEITVQYTPTVKGEYSAVMNVYTNDPLNRMKVVNVSGNIYEPNSISATGEVSENGYDLKVTLDNYTEIAAVQMDVHWSPELSTSKDLLTLGERMNGFSYVVEPVDDGVYRLIFYSLGGNTIAQGNSEAFTLPFENSANVNFNNTEITIDNIVLSSVDGENVSSQIEFTYNVKAPILGDINGDGEVNVTDVVTLYSYILGNTTGIDENVVDLNGDGEVNVTDIVSLYSIILNSNN
ncbi:MAG: choice-of-anchor D domain-containing protein [Bacteroidales bacterium]|nr:choice-of-anchor D domain-containing protein [Bacteroidales bacterium]